MKEQNERKILTYNDPLFGQQECKKGEQDSGSHLHYTLHNGKY